MFCTECGFENLVSFKFCANCGAKNLQVDVEPTKVSPSTLDDEIVQYVVRPQGVFLGLDNDKIDENLCDIYKKMVGAKFFDDILFDAIFTNKRVLIRPVSKIPAHMWMLGALISPSLATTADLLNRKVSSFLTSPSDSLIGKSVELDILSSLPYWTLKSINEVKQSLPSLWNGAGTIISFKEQISFNVDKHNTNLLLVFEGSATQSKKQFKEYSGIARLCNFDDSRIGKV